MEGGSQQHSQCLQQEPCLLLKLQTCRMEGVTFHLPRLRGGREGGRDAIRLSRRWRWTARVDGMHSLTELPAHVALAALEKTE